MLSRPASLKAAARAASAAAKARNNNAAAVAVPAARGFATVQDPPKRSHGGLRDQDRIFQNAYMRHDHLLKGAMVSLFEILLACMLRT